MKTAFRPFLIPLVCAWTLTACGGGDDPVAASTPAAAAPVVAAPATATCDTSLFSAAVALPTGAQLAPYAKTYAGDIGSFDMNGNFTKTGSATLVLNADGSATYNGAAIDVKSLCYEDGGSKKPVYIHWGTKTTVGMGAVYDDHVDLFNDGTFSGFIGGTVFRNP